MFYNDVLEITVVSLSSDKRLSCKQVPFVEKTDLNEWAVDM